MKKTFLILYLLLSTITFADEEVVQKNIRIIIEQVELNRDGKSIDKADFLTKANDIIKSHAKDDEAVVSYSSMNKSVIITLKNNTISETIEEKRKKLRLLISIALEQSKTVKPKVKGPNSEFLVKRDQIQKTFIYGKIKNPNPDFLTQDRLDLLIKKETAQSKRYDGFFNSKDGEITYWMEPSAVDALNTIIDVHTNEKLEVALIVRAIRGTQSDLNSLRFNFPEIIAGGGSSLTTFEIGNTGNDFSYFRAELPHEKFSAALSAEKNKSKNLSSSMLNLIVPEGHQEEVSTSQNEFRPIPIMGRDGVVTFNEVRSGAEIHVRNLKINKPHTFSSELAKRRVEYYNWISSGEGKTLSDAIKKLRSQNILSSSEAQILYESEKELHRKNNAHIERIEKLYKKLSISFEYTAKDGGFTDTIVKDGNEASARGETSNIGAITIKHGHNATLGGHRIQRDNKTEVMTPLASKIPLIGNLFKSREKNKTINEVIFVASAVIIDHNTIEQLAGNFSVIKDLIDQREAVIDHPLGTNIKTTKPWLISSEKDYNGLYLGAINRALKKIKDAKKNDEYNIYQISKIWQKHVVFPIQETDVSNWTDIDHMINQITILDTVGDGGDFLERMEAVQMEVSVKLSLDLSFLDILAIARHQGKIGGVVSIDQKHVNDDELSRGLLIDYLRDLLITEGRLEDYELSAIRKTTKRKYLKRVIGRGKKVWQYVF